MPSARVEAVNRKRATSMSHTFLQPSIGVGVALIEDGKILLTKRRDFPVWCIPGGHLLPRESITAAAIREAREETGLEVELLDLVGVYSMPDKWENGSCEIILRACKTGGELVRSTKETVDASFFSADQFPADLIGWQYHQAVDALSDKVGTISVLDARLSLSQFPGGMRGIVAGEPSEMLEWLKEICKRPKRVDLILG
jgi:ADP-ribose pyrophosphatase YjhB (NUDIX family)